MTDQVKELTVELAKARDEAAKYRDEAKEIGEKLKGQMENGEKVAADLKARADEALTKMNGMEATITELQQKAARNGGTGEKAVKSLGQQLVDSPEFKKFQNNNGNGQSVRIKATDYIGSTAANADGDAGVLVRPQVLPGVVELPQMRLTVRDLISPGHTDSNAITYIKETGFTNNAATVAEGAQKPQSTLKFDEVLTSVKVIAHHMPASKQILSDAPMLASTIDQRLMYGLKYVEEQQLLNGDGTGSNLNGIIPQASAFADPASLAAYTIIDQLRLAQLQALLAEYPSTGHVLNPIDWTKIELEKDTTGRHIIGNPQGTANPTMWGLPVVQTPAMTSGKFLTGAFKLGAQLFDRWEMEIAIATQHGENFTHNLVTILCEERLALAVYRPEAFIFGTLAAKTA